jgi:hypothetical protein
MLLEIFEQIEKELDYAEHCHPNQQITKIESLKFAIHKLHFAMTCVPSCVHGNTCICTDTDKYVCSSFAAMAILMRGIEQELKVAEPVVKKSFKKRLKLFDSMFKSRPQIKLTTDNSVIVR